MVSACRYDDFPAFARGAKSEELALDNRNLAAAVKRLRAALDQIKAVCDDNADAACNQAMALAFVRSVAVDALGTNE